MKSVIVSVSLAVLLSGCASSYQMSVPLNTSYNLDGTGSSYPASPKKVRKPPRSSYASIETTGSIDGQSREQELYTELGKYKANTPEWFNVRRKIENDRTEQFNRERQQLMICRNC